MEIGGLRGGITVSKRTGLQRGQWEGPEDEIGAEVADIYALSAGFVVWYR